MVVELYRACSISLVHGALPCPSWTKEIACPPPPPPCAPHEHTPHRPSTTPTPSLPAALPGAVFSMEDSLVLIQALLQTAPEGADSSQAKATYVYNAMSLSHQP